MVTSSFAPACVRGFHTGALFALATRALISEPLLHIDSCFCTLVLVEIESGLRQLPMERVLQEVVWQKHRQPT